MQTVYHSQFWAHALTLRGFPDSSGSLARALAKARIDLHAHQLEAARFALSSPLSRGAILADEAGLGGIVEAGLVLSSHWADNRRRILVIVPGPLRREWARELAEKFYLPAIVMDTETHARLQREGARNPFEQNGHVVIASYHLAAHHANQIGTVQWDVAVLDEAHRVRDHHEGRNKAAVAIRKALDGRYKLLLTPTPVQRSMEDLYGLATFIDPYLFGSLDSFRQQYINASDEEAAHRECRSRMARICHRTARRQVPEYPRATRRTGILRKYEPTDEEQQLRDVVTAYLRRGDTEGLPAASREESAALLLCRSVASSTDATADTLRRIVHRLETIADNFELFEPDVDLLLDEDYEDEQEPEQPEGTGDEPSRRRRIGQEIAELKAHLLLAEGVEENGKGKALLKALGELLAKPEGTGGHRKALIFTESRHTQLYLHRLLAENGYRGQVVLLNKGATDEGGRVDGQKHADGEGLGEAEAFRAGIVEDFRERATIMIATEAGVEGLSFPFCSLVVNYDLPWNPRRVEHRISRCHRYGQRRDVTVLNFLNEGNPAEVRAHQILSRTFRLFDGPHGGSEEILNLLDSGAGIERRMAAIQYSLREPEEVEAAFDALEEELAGKLSMLPARVCQAVLEGYDEEVRARLETTRAEVLEALAERNRWLAGLTRLELGAKAEWSEDGRSFVYLPRQRENLEDAPPLLPEYDSVRFFLDWREAERHTGAHYHAGHPLAQALIKRARERQLPIVDVVFDYSGQDRIIPALEPLQGRSGWLELCKLTVESLGSEEFLFFAALLDDGTPVGEDVCQRLFRLPGSVNQRPVNPTASPDLVSIREAGVRTRLSREAAIQQRLAEVSQRNCRYFDSEVMKLNRWSEDLKFGPEREIRAIRLELNEARAAVTMAHTLEEKLQAQKAVKATEAKRSHKRLELFQEQEAIDRQRNELVEKVEEQLQQRTSLSSLYRIRWHLKGLFPAQERGANGSREKEASGAGDLDQDLDVEPGRITY